MTGLGRGHPRPGHSPIELTGIGVLFIWGTATSENLIRETMDPLPRKKHLLNAVHILGDSLQPPEAALGKRLAQLSASVSS